jgi:cytochrome c551
MYLIAIISLILLLAACGGKEEAGGSVTLSGEQLFAQSCSSCHGKDLKSGYAPDLDQIGTKYTTEEIASIIEDGSGPMPSEILKGDEATAVAEWLAEQK